MEIFRTALACCVAEVFLFHSSAAQDTSQIHNDSYYWINGGVGASSFGVAGGISIALQNENTLFSVRTIFNGEVNILGPSPAESVWDVGLLYGICTREPYEFVSAAGGISFVSGIRRGKYLGSSGWFSAHYESLPFFTVGIPIEGQLFWTPFSFFGCGIYAFANVNPEKGFWGAMLALRFGKLR